MYGETDLIYTLKLHFEKMFTQVVHVRMTSSYHRAKAKRHEHKEEQQRPERPDRHHRQRLGVGDKRQAGTCRQHTAPYNSYYARVHDFSTV